MHLSVSVVSKKTLTAVDFSNRLKNLTLPERGQSQHFILAVSGGPDSLAMMVLAAKARQKNLDFSVATVDHGLRVEAKQEARYVARLAKQFGLAHKTLTYNGAKPSSDIQAAARKMRYDLLLDWSEQQQSDGLVLAHHMEDQAETFLLRLARGSGLDGLSAMQDVRIVNGQLILRPFLDIPKAKLAQVVARAKIKPVDDPSNRNERFDRVKIRAAMPAFEKLGLTSARLAETAVRLQSSRQTLSEITQQAIDNLVAYDEFGVVTLQREGFQQLSEEIGLRLLRWLLSPAKTFGEAYPPRYEALEKVYQAIMETGTGGRTLGGYALRMRRSEVIVHRELAACMADMSLKPGQEVIWDNRFFVKLAPRFKQTVRVKPLGKAGAQMLRDKGIALPTHAPAGALHSLASAWQTTNSSSRGKKLIAVAGLITIDGLKIDILPQKQDTHEQ